MGPPAHRRVPVLPGELERPVAHPRHVPLGDIPDGPEHQREPGVRQILHCGPVVHPLPGVLRQHRPQRRDQPHGRVPGRPGLLRHQVQVDQPDISVGPDRLGRRRWYQSHVGLRLGQGRQDLQPGLGPALVGEQGRRLGRAPEVAEDRRISRVRAAAHRLVLPAARFVLPAADQAGAPGHQRSPLWRPLMPRKTRPSLTGGTPQRARSTARTSSRLAPQGRRPLCRSPRCRARGDSTWSDGRSGVSCHDSGCGAKIDLRRFR